MFTEHWYNPSDESVARKVCDHMYLSVCQPDNPASYQYLCWIFMAAEQAGADPETMCEILEIPIDEL